ncbi:hypothetical protein CK203_011316 [Vitis vinifera]|uniref:Uncharacterized protein n=1 Tax=Vitis vinifera TaxID=29760 RepID=A0A438JYW5_VITVI|nr:hypothetical protein CK203_011316 [Vitis vinifera]
MLRRKSHELAKSGEVPAGSHSPFLASLLHPSSRPQAPSHHILLLVDWIELGGHIEYHAVKVVTSDGYQFLSRASEFCFVFILYLHGLEVTKLVED